MALINTGLKVGSYGNVDLADLLVRREIFEGGVGALWAWGDNSYGQLGTNDRTNRSSPIQTVAGGNNWKQAEMGPYNAGGIKTDGTLWTWGMNYQAGVGGGFLGLNDNTDRSSPTQIYGGGTDWKQVSVGGRSMSAIKTDGTLWLWGVNNAGQLGLNDITDRSSPTQIYGGGANWKQVTFGFGSAGAIKTDGTLWLWGGNGLGALGTNDTTNRSSPIQTVSGGTNWKQISIGGFVVSTGAIKTDGTLWMWGRNNYGQLGNNSITDRSSPTQIYGGGTNWKQVSAGEASAGIKTDGTLWLWGYNGNGALGTNDITNRSSPVQTVAGGTNWKQVSVERYDAAAIKTDGTLWCWGINNYGQLGTNDITSRSSPVQTVAGGTIWRYVDSATGSRLALTDSSL